MVAFMLPLERVEGMLGVTRFATHEVPAPARAYAHVEFLYASHVGPSQCDGHGLHVVVHAPHTDRLRDDHNAPVQLPRNGDLRGRCTVARADFSQHRVGVNWVTSFHQRTRSERAVSREHNVVFFCRS